MADTQQQKPSLSSRRASNLRVSMDDTIPLSIGGAVPSMGPRRNSSLMTPRNNLVTPRVNNRALIRTSLSEDTKKKQKRFNWNLQYDDPDVELIYREESWLKKRRGLLLHILVISLGGANDLLRDTRLIAFPFNLLVALLSAVVFFAVLSPTVDAIRLVKLITSVSPFTVSVLMMADIFHCGHFVVPQEQCDPSKGIPACWLLLPIQSLFTGYYAPASFSETIPGRAIMITSALVFMASRCQNREDWGTLLGFAAGLWTIIWRVHALEARDRALFLEAHLMKSNTLATEPAKDEADQQAEMTLVRNAMRLTFPDNPFHDAATEQRIERCRTALGVPNQDTYVSEGLTAVPGAMVPRQLQFIASKLRGMKLARYKLHGDPVMVHSITNMDVLESDQDLETFIRIVRDASDLAPIPGLTKTIGFCLAPCTFVVDDLLDYPPISLHDLSLELSAKELRLDWCFFKPLGACLIEALALLRRNGILHKNVSSHSILLLSKEMCVLPPISFYHAFPEARKKLWGHMPGMWTAPPECASSPESYSPASEVYAVCVVAWEMLVGPFSAQITPFAVPATVPKVVVDLIIDGLSNDPDGRPTMDELFDAFNMEEPSRESSAASAEVFMAVLSRLEVTPSPDKPPSRRVSSKKSKMTSSTSSGGDTTSLHPSTSLDDQPASVPPPSVMRTHSNEEPKPSPMRGNQKVTFASFDDSKS